MEIELVIDNSNKKTKAEDFSIDPTTTKKARPVDVMDMSKDEIAQSLGEWFDTCDPELRKQGYGWGFYPTVAEDYTKTTNSKVVSCAPYYKDKEESLLASDKALCEGICSIHVFHIAAKEWSARPEICYGGYEQQVLFYVMKHKLLKNKKDCLEKFVDRLMALSYEYNPRFSYENIRNEDNSVTLKRTECSMTEIPPNQHASFAIFFYPNLQFLWKREDESTYTLASHDIKKSLDGFCNALKQINSKFPHCCANGFGESFEAVAKECTDHAIGVYHTYLAKRKVNPSFKLEFSKKPLSIQSYTAYSVQL